MRSRYAGRSSLVSLLALILFIAGGTPPTAAQSKDSTRDAAGRIIVRSRAGVSPLIGKWSYRSFRSNPDLSADPNSLLFGSGTMDITLPTSDHMTGTLGGDGWQLALTGTVTGDAPTTIRFQGRGTIGGEEWVYDYLGYVVPAWPNGVDQRPAIVGTIVRTVPHTGGTAIAGYVAQWIAVKQDAASPAPLPLRSLAPPEPAGVVRQLKELEMQWAAAVGTNDPEQIGRFFTGDFLFVGAGGVLQDRGQHLDDFRTGRLRVESVAITEFTSHSYENFAVVNSLAHVRGKLGERDITGDYRFMDTWRFDGQKWLAVARQQTRVAVPPPSTGLRKSAFELQELRDTLSARLETARFDQLKVLSAADPELDSQLPASQRLSLARAATGELTNPPVAVPGADGKIVLEAKYADNLFGTTSPVPLRLRSYNGKLVGPTIRAKAGQTINIRLVNNLPTEPLPVSHDSDGHHAWNTTNLHTHGLHVKPQANPASPVPAAVESDNVLLELPPGQSQEYAFEIPTNHPAGTFWYHAHKHGSTSAQVSSGMAGALIVSRDNSDEHLGNLDSVAEIQGATEKIMVLQQVPFVMHGGKGVIEIGDADTIFSPGGAGSWHQSGHSTTLNGKLLPVITLKTGEIQRWRMIHSGFRELLKLQLEKDPSPAIGGNGPSHILLHQVAVDGLPLSKRDPRQEIELYPGYRSDVLVQAPATRGVYYLIDAASPAGNSLFGENEPLKFIAKVVITDEPAVAMSLPSNEQIAAHRLVSLVSPPSTEPVQEAYYGITASGFVIGKTDPGATNPVVGTPFSAGVTRQLTLGKTQRWLIGTRNAPGIGVAHPFHIHVNPFEVLAIRTPDGRNILEDGPIWRDTIAMPQGYTIELVSKYEDFVGSFVQHCHILDHEDRGMMQKVTISASTPVNSPLARSGTAVRENAIVRSVPEPNGEPSILFFVQDSLCPHCMAQLTSMSNDLSNRRLQVTVVSASTEYDLKSFPKVPFTLVADPDHRLFKDFRVYDGKTRHATIVRDGAGKELLRRVGEAPFTDAAVVLAALDNSSPSFASRTTAAVEKEIIGANPPQWNYLADSTASRPATIGRSDGRMVVPAKNGDVISFKVASGSHAALFENAKTEIDAGVWEVVADSGALEELPDGRLPHYNHTVARVSHANSGDLIKIRIKNLRAGSAILFACNPHSESPTGANVSMLGAIVLDAQMDAPSRLETARGCQCASTSTLSRVRKNIDCLTPQELRNLEHAFKILQDRSASNPNDQTGYDYQVRIHRQSCAHNTELIWPWHRAFLYYFEDLLRAADPDHPDTPTRDVTLPYWDWTKTPSGSVGYPSAYENPSSPLFHNGRNTWGTASPPPLFTDADIGLDIPDWYLFGGSTTGPGQLEAGARPGPSPAPHNDGHSTYVGGDMAFPSVSVKDPIFWAHHANLDRLWDLWQQRWHVNPDQQTVAMRGWPATVTPIPVVSNFNDIRTQLRYDYCNPVTPNFVDLRLADRVRTLSPTDDRPLSLRFNPDDLRPVRPTVRHSRAQVRLSGVKRPTDTTYQAKVFIHRADVAAQPGNSDFVRVYQAAAFTLWAMGSEHGDHADAASNPPLLDLNLDVTEKYEELVRSLPPGAELAVTFDFAAGNGRERRRVPYGQEGIEFSGARLVVNPLPPTTSRP